MAGEPPPEVNGPPVGPEAQGAGGGPRPPEKTLTPEQLAAQAAEQAAEPESPGAAKEPAEGLESLASPDQTPADAKVEQLREVPPSPGQPGATPQPPEATGAGDGEPPEQPESQNVDTVANAISREVTADAQRQERYARMPQTQRDKNLQIQQGVLERLETRRSLTLDTAEIDAIDLLIDRAQNEIGSIESAPPPPAGTNGGSLRITQEELQAATRRVDTQIEDLSQLSKMRVEDLTTEKGSEQAKLEALNRVLEGPVTNAEKAAVQARIRDSGARIKAIDELRGKKEPEEQKAIRGKEAQSSAEDLEAKRRETDNVPGLTQAVGRDRLEVERIVGEIEEIDKNINAATGEERTKLETDRARLARQEISARDRLSANEEAFKNAQKRERDEFTLTEKLSPDTLREVSREEYIAMSDEDAARYLDEVRKMFPGLSNLDAIRLHKSVMSGEPLGIKDRALYSDYLANKLTGQEGRTSEDLETMKLLLDRYPEMARYVMDKVVENNAQIKAFKEQNPDGWEKMLKFAGRNKHWLLIILAIIAGTAAAGVGVVAGPIAGGLAGAGSAGAAGGGVGYFGSRRAA